MEVNTPLVPLVLWGERFVHAPVAASAALDTNPGNGGQAIVLLAKQKRIVSNALKKALKVTLPTFIFALPTCLGYP